MQPLTILFTNAWLSQRGGTELYLRDLTIALHRRGHRALVYTPILGAVSDELRSAGIEVSDQWTAFPDDIDLIHGQHHLETLAALMRFPDAPAIHVCHGIQPWEEMAPRFPRILKYCAVDEPCRERVMRETGLDRDAVALVLNFADMNRFKARTDYSAKPRRALLFHSGATPTAITPTIQAACRQAGLPLEVIGYQVHNPCAQPERRLLDYDLVFAGGRSAIEALACGCAVILVSLNGTGPLVVPANFDTLRPLNFGCQATPNPFDPQLVFRQIQAYRTADVQAVTRRIRAEAGLEDAVTTWEVLYRDVRDQARAGQAQGWDRRAESRALADYLPLISRHYQQTKVRLALAEKSNRELQDEVFRYSTLGSVRLRNWIRRHLAMKI